MIWTCAVVTVRRVNNSCDTARLRTDGNRSGSAARSFRACCSFDDRTASFVLYLRAHNPERIITKVTGVARRKSGEFERVQYRNNPTFLAHLAETSYLLGIHTSNDPERMSRC